MAFVIKRGEHSQPIYVASAIIPLAASGVSGVGNFVTLIGSSTLMCGAMASSNLRPFGAVDASYGAGEYAAVYEHSNVVKAVAAASVGAGVPVTIASTNGGVGPNVISASAHWEVGLTESAAAAGEVVSIYIQPRKA